MKYIGIVAAMLILLIIGGCAFLQSQSSADAKANLLKAEAAVEEVQSALSLALEQKAQILVLIESLPDGELKDTAVAKLSNVESVISALQQKVEITKATLETLNREIADAKSWLDIAAGTVTAVAPLLPAPWGAIAGAVGGLVIGLLRAWRNKKAAIAVIQSVQPIVTKALTPAVSETLSAKQGSAGQALVDAAQGKGTVLPF